MAVAAGLTGKHNEAIALVGQMTLQEKAGLCSGRGFWHLKAIERLQLPRVMVTDGPHGLRKQTSGGDHVGLNASVPATCFPTAAAMACSWNRSLIEEVGVALGNECVKESVTVLLGPGINIKRHPLCGRNFEYYSEDPLLAGELAAAWILGVQSRGVGTSLKHFAVNNQETGRMTVDAIVDERTLREIYLRAFEIAVTKAQPWTVMSAYNRLNGEYCGEHSWLLNKVLRDDWGFKGLVVSDWGATNRRVEGLGAGMDLEMPGSGGVNDRLIEAAVRQGELQERVLDQTAVRITSLILAGRDLAESAPQPDMTANHGLARRIAAESCVLLKNEGNLLPLAQDTHLAVIGSFAQVPRIQGAGSSQVNPTQVDDAYTALTEQFGRPLPFARGYDQQSTTLDSQLIDAAVELAKAADTALLFVGLPAICESEGFDRSEFAMPEQHLALINAVCDVNANTVVILTSGSPVEMTWSHRPRAILATYLLGQAGGGAIADLITGRTNPSGKLAETWVWRQADVPCEPWFAREGRQVQYRDGLLVGYRYYNTANKGVAFPFGHGLSYTSFDYENIDAPSAWSARAGSLIIRVNVANSGNRSGSEVVQLYVGKTLPGVFRPAHELKGFCKLHLRAGEIGEARFELDRRSFSYFDSGHQRWCIEAGDYELQIGASSHDIRLRCTINIEEADTPSRQGSAPGPQVSSDVLEVSDAVFEGMLGRPIPAPEPSRPFHRNSTLDEIAQTRLGAWVRYKAIQSFQSRMGGTSNDPTLNKMFDQMAKSMPLRALALFAGGSITNQQIDALIHMLNNRWFRAIGEFVRRR